MRWYLTVWLLYGDAPPPPDLPAPQQWEFPDQAGCLGAQQRWDAAAVRWMQRNPALHGRVVSSRCDPEGKQPAGVERP